LAGQVYRAGLFEREGFVIWDNSWYAGHHLPGYSLTWPWLASWLGLRASAVVAVLASVWIFERLAGVLYGPGASLAAVWFAVAAVGDAWIGRLTFALGVTFALAAALALVYALAGANPGPEPARNGFAHAYRGGTSLARGGRERARRRGLVGLAALLATVCAATSPVAGLLLVLAVCSWALGGAITARTASPPKWKHLARAGARRMRPVWPLVIPPLVVAVALQVLFPEGGFEPYAASSIAATLAVTLAFILALPPQERVLRVGAGVYVLVNLVCLIPSTPMGSNVQRYGVLLAGPLLLCALIRDRERRRQSLALSASTLHSTPSIGASGSLGLRPSRLPARALIPALVGMAVWVLWGPAVQTLAVSGDPSTRASFYTPVKRFFAARDEGPLRVEVPFTRAHWEAAYLAPAVSLARGWERQLDKRYDRSLESSTLSASAYRRWLEREGVSYVALPDVPFDYSSKAEVRLIREGLPYLREVFRAPHWRIYKVMRPSPLVLALHRGSARLTALEPDRFTMSITAGGRFLVKVHYTPYWALSSGAASVRSGREGFTEVQAPRPGRISVVARFSAAGAWRALGIA
jgi:hypothetical protein